MLYLEVEKIAPQCALEAGYRTLEDTEPRAADPCRALHVVPTKGGGDVVVPLERALRSHFTKVGTPVLFTSVCVCVLCVLCAGGD